MRFPTIARDGCRRPLVPVLLESAQGSQLMVDALIDTGAGVTLFPAAIAESLGIDLTDAPDRPLSSALGVIATYREHKISLELRRAPNEIHRWQASVGFISRPMVYGILGTRGFFEIFTLTYNAADEWVQLDPGRGFPI